jgi:hypothetical protein
MDLETATTGFQVTRLTEDSFIVSTPARRPTEFEASIDFRIGWRF